MEIIMKMSIKKSEILLLIKVSDFNCFQISLLIWRNPFYSLLRNINFRKEVSQKVHILQGKTECQKYKVSVTLFAKLIPAKYPQNSEIKTYPKSVTKF